MEDSAFQTCRLHIGRFVDLHPTRRRPRRSEAEPVTITATAMLLPAFEPLSLRNWAHELFRERLLFNHNAQAAQCRKQWCDALLASVAVLPNLGAETGLWTANRDLQDWRPVFLLWLDAAGLRTRASASTSRPSVPVLALQNETPSRSARVMCDGPLALHRDARRSHRLDAQDAAWPSK